MWVDDEDEIVRSVQKRMFIYYLGQKNNSKIIVQVLGAGYDSKIIAEE